MPAPDDSRRAKSTPPKSKACRQLDRAVYPVLKPAATAALPNESPYARAPWEKYSKSTLYVAVTRTISETKQAGKPLVPPYAPIGYLPGDDVTPSKTDMRTLLASASCPVSIRIVKAAGS